MLEVSKRLKEFDSGHNIQTESVGKQPEPRMPPAQDEIASQESSRVSMNDSFIIPPGTMSNPPGDDSPEIPLKSTKLVIGSPAKPRILTKYTPAVSERKEERKSNGLDIAGRGSTSQSASSIPVPLPEAVGTFTF
jgi:hypothetical protein